MKVHFAGLENSDFAIVLNKISGVQYGLFTVFPFIAGKFGIKAMKFSSCNADSSKILETNFKNVIMDSGLFTLMFGAHAGKRDLSFVERWQEEIVNHVHEMKYNGVVVEVDCQKILGVDTAWKLRKKLRKQLTNPQINVYHAEDGAKGLDKMIDFSDYIAISVPELRKIGAPNLPEYVSRQAGYIKNKKPEIKIHLLGCTAMQIMKSARFCDSCDSTSWQQVNRFGAGSVLLADNKHIKASRTMYETNSTQYNDRVRGLFKTYNVSHGAKRNMTYYSSYALAAMYLKKRYSLVCGNQN